MAGERSEVNALFSKSEHQKRELESLLAAFAEHKAAHNNVASQQRLAAMISQFSSTVENFGQEVSGLNGKNRALWERRAANLQDDLVSIQRDVDKQLGPFYKAQKEEEDRNKLFGGKESRKAQKVDDEMTALARERGSLGQASAALDDIVGQGQQILGSLVGQNKILKGARRKLLDAANAMGVSASLVSVIDRRQTGDKWLVYGGMVLTLFILFSLWYLLRW
mmetsp:Transcript_43290/g.100335  ORF Transcript_43290/g.100335 Transcript_43290/m.100335 type:complete len:222 (-) Transcript_43290:128-793(-)|eukprot:CAMPEP_0171093516 /NCGR_PEP_ID=MMETSP0766_2-20121228/39124_1 /TAXON_ID=439317 /ORGANISM="Gambierdiscus australes, Strain CAWD 149" /LENGTH=221 /DNA_ID=CAMNT_0011551971 /DNA_START=66 /DNA_END=731 /DNA_ORIENTATION=+